MRTAIITGACSGMGLALTWHLLNLRDHNEQSFWRVVLADVNAKAYENISATLASERHLFVRCDVSKWSDLAALFKRAFEWSGGQINFFANNAGIDDLQLRKTPSDSEEPVEPDLKVLAVDLHAVFYGTELFTHYTKKTRRTSTSEHFHPKMVITASCASLYPFFLIPQYTAAKHGCLGYVRAIAPKLWSHDGIALNCIMPGTVDTGIIPTGILSQWPKNCLTPLETVVRAFDELIDLDGWVNPDGLSDGREGEIKWGCAVEVSVDRLYYRNHIEFADLSQKWVVDQSREDGILGKAAKAMQD